MVVATARKESGLRQNDMAAATGLSQSSWSKIERGHQPMPVDKLWVAAEAVGMRVSTIVEAIELAESSLRVMDVSIVDSEPEQLMSVSRRDLAALAKTALKSSRSNRAARPCTEE